MSVESINASSVTTNISQPTTQLQNVERNNESKQGKEVKPVEQVAATESTEDELNAAVDKLNDFVGNVAQRDLSFSIDKETDKFVVVVKDKLTQDVIRQMPTEEALAVAKQIESMLGLILNDKA